MIKFHCKKENEKKSWQQKIYSTSLHVNFFQNNIQMKCLLTLNLLTVTFFLLFLSLSLFLLLTSFTRSCLVKLLAGWDGQTRIEFKKTSFVLAHRVLFILIPSSSHHTHLSTIRILNFLFYMSFMCSAFDEIYIVRHLRVHDFQLETETNILSFE